MSDRPPTALVVDDEAQMVSIVAFALQTQGFSTDTARNAEQAWTKLRSTTFDLVVLDVMLPGASGIQLCERIRSTFDTPVVLVTARGEEDDRLKGLLAGADDYVTKPFSPRELALRATAVVRRTRGQQHDHAILANGALRVDPSRRIATLRGRHLRLSDVEFRLLVTLTSRAGTPVEWRTLLNEVWHTGELAGGRDIVKTAICRLRHSIGPTADELILTVRAVGYMMPRLEPDATTDS
jgi:DNA-binding response OmpR family regulator